ncbi:proton-conducting transporter transmembrane domain-containing protein [Roseiconus lacunae]|uniref:proton-conducting transporter transmembrane domain-containing protein n=1 Tax=Roseiconus lacunae TaxID=2605694 RepID=UPI001E3025EB|nr:proton-conducting transporter membrane subunit [Roseiconus lacunae]MCD0462560.1 oxidoreductase [Roseiconus lacunae]
MLETAFHWLGVAVVTSPLVLLVSLGLASLFGCLLQEKTIARLTQFSIVSGLAASLAILALMLQSGVRNVPIEIGNWVSLPDEGFHFHLKFVFDRLSVPFTMLSFILCGTVGAFTNNYLHRERGYNRFFMLYAIFLVGMVVSSLAGTIETLFFGWELVGLSSALLVAYFHDRRNPVQNGQHVWVVYRIADAAFLIAALALHHLTGAGDFDKLVGTGAWPEGHASIEASHALYVGLLLLIAAAGKSALLPFSGWLPRAMEGPTPSSAIFYGALSVHLGAYLLLRVSALLEASMVLSGLVIAVGLVSAIFGALTARVQTDIKSVLAFASLTQVGIIVAEIGFGLRYIALIHIIGHACLRTLQLLRAPTLLHDYNGFENAIGSHLSVSPIRRSRWTSPQFQNGVYAIAIYQAFLDEVLKTFVARPFLRIFQWCDRAERRWTSFLSRDEHPIVKDEPTHPGSLEEFV